MFYLPFFSFLRKSLERGKKNLITVNNQMEKKNPRDLFLTCYKWEGIVHTTNYQF